VSSRESESFPFDPRSVPGARRFVRDALGRLPQETIEVAELMVSELATNCIRHAGTGFDLSVRTGEEIRVEVTDVGRGTPRVLTPGPEEPSGRGLRIVEGLSARWGVSERPEGKTVWFTLRTPAPEPSSAGGRGLRAMRAGERLAIAF
jgi:anti-sigma regulatory factor (Ser/Thr protein kinase)